ncbi:MAG: zinc-binding dehydrogenase, partial [Spirochaetota bacterium]|nr:zinc-binding dehydrogenase [Spirochaetota bacterium]
AIKLAKQLGLTVTGVSSAHNFKLLGSLGVNKAIDYNCEDFGNELYDLIFDSSGEISYSYCEKALKANGRFVSII